MRITLKKDKRKTIQNSVAKNISNSKPDSYESKNNPGSSLHLEKSKDTNLSPRPLLLISSITL